MRVHYFLSCCLVCILSTIFRRHISLFSANLSLPDSWSALLPRIILMHAYLMTNNASQGKRRSMPSTTRMAKAPSCETGTWGNISAITTSLSISTTRKSNRRKTGAFFTLSVTHSFGRVKRTLDVHGQMPTTASNLPTRILRLTQTHLFTTQLRTKSKISEATEVTCFGGKPTPSRATLESRSA